MGQTLAILYHTALETLRARSLAWAAAGLATLFAVSLFLREIALTDGLRLQTTFLAATSRLLCSFTVAAVIIGGVVREFNEQGQLLLLSLPLGRARYLLGKFLGFALVALLLALVAGMIVALAAEPGPTALWTLALAMELLVVTAMGVFAAFGLRQLVPALLATLGFYVLARGIGGMQLLAHAAGATPGWVGGLANGLALLLPDLSAFASSARLLGEGPGLAPVAVQTCLYCALLLSAAVADVARRDL